MTTGERITLYGFFISIVSCIGTYLAIPGVQEFIAQARKSSFVSVALLLLGGILLIIALVSARRKGNTAVSQSSTRARFIAAFCGAVFVLFGIALTLGQAQINRGMFSSLIAATLPPPIPLATLAPTATPTAVVEPPTEIVSELPTNEPPPPGQNNVSIEGPFEAAFIVGRPPYKWPPGVHTYIIEFGCSTNIQAPIFGNDGNPVEFTVVDLGIFDITPFYLRYDGVYDAMTNGEQIDRVDAASVSYATVVITRHTYEDAQRVLDECNAFISVDGLQRVRLERQDGPVENVQEIDLEEVPLYED